MMNILTRTAFTLAAAYAATTSATVTYAPISSGPSYALSLPQNTVSSGSGDIYFQLSAPTSYQWVGLGIGGQMAGASIFVMYADGSGNVTISARNGGAGHVEPLVDSTLKVELLEGSGISNGIMTANVLCTSCSSVLSSTTSTSSPWIAAWNQGSALNSASVSETINQHDGNAYRQFTFDLTKAVVSADANPFVTSTSGTGTASAAVPTSSSSSGSSGDDGSGASTVGTSFTVIQDYQKAHGIIMGVTVVLFPIAAMLMRLGCGVWVHGLLQIFFLAALLCGFGLGIKLADMTNLLYKGLGRTHTIFGTVIIALFLIQPFIGLLHHRSYLRTQKPSSYGYAHRWYGRILIILALVNGGLGLKLASNTQSGKIVYGVIAGVCGAAYLGVILSTMWKKGKAGKGKSVHRSAI